MFNFSPRKAWVLFALTFAGLFGWLLWQTPSGEIVETEEIIYYQVDALTISDLKAQIRTRGPQGYSGFVQWRVLPTLNGGLKLHTKITMPKHAAPDQLSSSVAFTWNRFVKALWKHERVHQYHGKRAAKEALQSAYVHHLAIFRKWSKQDDRFDKLTAHGATEGAWLP
ncbi:putative secreted Zn-dependent protease [Shimia isoporae]|uniref:Putative secreted Zn-dependent protease n=1 Tax=Shimia isoporae TaxID=647720 RepID=A0A4R1NJT3_9RHOB|nr:DUF922 domain-containing protein [Shimia isoporae]TCL08454.1 putative secreted Zn-dependent protease [Shimia isoporae]